MVLEDILSDMRGSTVFSIMADKSSDFSVVKQLMLYGRAVVEGNLKTMFFKILDNDAGKATTM